MSKVWFNLRHGVVEQLFNVQVLSTQSHTNTPIGFMHLCIMRSRPRSKVIFTIFRATCYKSSARGTYIYLHNSTRFSKRFFDRLVVRCCWSIASPTIYIYIYIYMHEQRATRITMFLYIDICTYIYIAVVHMLLLIVLGQYKIMYYTYTKLACRVSRCSARVHAKCTLCAIIRVYIVVYSIT